MQIDRTPRTYLGILPDGEEGTKATLLLMVALVRQYKSSPAVRGAAIDLVRDLPPKRWAAEIRALHEFVRDSIRYTADTCGVETVQTPEATLDLGVGDCDDKSTLLAALLESIGHPSRFVAVGPSPGIYTHVFVQTPIGGPSGSRWLALDATEPVPPGWTPRNVGAVMIANN